MPARLGRALALGLLLAVPALALAQDSAGPAASAVLVVDVERVFEQSAFGRRVTAEIERAGAEIAAENRRIEAELTAEEQSLTDERDRIATEDFRAIAEAFDEKVQRLRNEQDAKARALGQQSDAARREFIAAVQPVLETLMQEAGAAVILERRAVFARVEAVDITELAIARIDGAIGSGGPLAPAPDEDAEPDQP